MAADDHFPDGFLEPGAASELLGLPARRLRALARAGVLPCARPGRERRYCARTVRLLAGGGELVAARAAARRLGVGARTLARLVEAGRISPALVVARRGGRPGAIRFFSAGEVERFRLASVEGVR